MKIITSILNLFRKKSSTPLAEKYVMLRNQVFNLKNGDHQVGAISDLGLYALVLETGYAQAIVTLVAVSDGSASLYFSNGGGIIGAGTHELVRQEVSALLLSAPKYFDQLKKVEKVDLPVVGQVSISFVTKNGLYTISAPEKELGMNEHQLSPLFHEAQRVISAIRLVQSNHSTQSSNS